jgi:hypothetical protein
MRGLSVLKDELEELKILADLKINGSNMDEWLKRMDKCKSLKSPAELTQYINELESDEEKNFEGINQCIISIARSRLELFKPDMGPNNGFEGIETTIS